MLIYSWCSAHFHIISAFNVHAYMHGYMLCVCICLCVCVRVCVCVYTYTYNTSAWIFAYICINAIHSLHESKDVFCTWRTKNVLHIEAIECKVRLLIAILYVDLEWLNKGKGGYILKLKACLFIYLCPQYTLGMCEDSRQKAASSWWMVGQIVYGAYWPDIPDAALQRLIGFDWLCSRKSRPKCMAP